MNDAVFQFIDAELEEERKRKEQLERIEEMKKLEEGRRQLAEERRRFEEEKKLMESQREAACQSAKSVTPIAAVSQSEHTTHRRTQKQPITVDENEQVRGCSHVVIRLITISYHGQTPL